jgi:septum formation protein
MPAILIIVNKPQLHLASSSLRRRELLTTLGLSFSHAGVDLDETPLKGESVQDMVLRLALGKAQLAARARSNDLPILGADTAVALGDRILGKPDSEEDALQMLAVLSGQTHLVLTAVAVAVNGSTETALVTSEVTFREISPPEAQAYWDTGEPRGKAGAYAVQGIGGVFVQHLTGSYSAVVGLPVFETAVLLGNAGVNALPSYSELE